MSLIMSDGPSRRVFRKRHNDKEHIKNRAINVSITHSNVMIPEAWGKREINRERNVLRPGSSGISIEKRDDTSHGR